ncbi:MAG: FixH family protein [Ferruginibacter sp.]
MTKKIFHSGNLVLVGFGGMVIFMSVLVYMCMQNGHDLVSKNYYEQEANHGKIVAAASNANAFGDSFSVKESGQKIQLQVPASLSNSMESGKVIFFCIPDSRLDKTVALEKNEKGFYEIDASNWQRTRYKAQVSLVKEGKEYYKEMELTL